jgi:hypothetical protein
MTDRFPEDDLARLIREAADQVQPRPALDAIRARTVTSPQESPMSVARTWLLGGLGGAVATAAVIGGVWFATTNGHDDSPTPGPAGSPSGVVSGTPAPSDTGSPSPADSDASRTKVAVPVYWVGDTPSGERLYREFVRVPESDRLADAVRTSLNGEPADRDYRSLWPTAAVLGVHVDGAGSDLSLTVDLGGASTLHDRPAGMTEAQAQLAIQQLLYTVQGAAGAGRVPVQLLLDGKHTDTVLGVPTAEPLSNAPVLKTLSLVNISTPAEGDVITGDTLDVTGVGSSFEANFIVKLQRFEGTYVAFQEPLTGDGWMGDKLFPFKGSFDISKVAPGTYTLSVTTDDPSDGEGTGPFTDSKVITVK